MNYITRNRINRILSHPVIFPLFHKYKNLFSRPPEHHATEVEKFHKKNTVDINAKSSVEIGAGMSLAQNLFLSNILERQYLFDIDNLLNMKFVRSYAYQLTDVFDLEKNKVTSVEDLKKVGICYNAPCDVLTVNSIKNIDIFLSNSVLEHIPKKDIEPIMLKIKSMLRTGGRLSLHIDYSDHLSHNDPSIGRHNFLQFSDIEWQYFNTKICYQNRLRHTHYKKIFMDCGFRIIDEEAKAYEEAPSFIDQSLMTGHETDLATTGRWVLEKV